MQSIRSNTFPIVLLAAILLTAPVLAVPWKPVVWSRDGQIITANLDGTEQETVLSTPGVAYDAPVFSPDFQKLAYSRYEAGSFEICVWRDTGITCAPSPGLHITFGWDDDSERIYFPRNQGDGQVWMIDFSAPSPTPVPFFDPPVYRSLGLTVSTDGSRMILVHDPHNWTYDAYITSYDFSSGTETTIYPSNGRTDAFPDFSPTRDEIVWGEKDGGCCSSKHDVWIMDADGTDPRPLTSTPNITDRRPKFSPDGAQVYYLRETALWVMGRDGALAQELFDLGTPFTFFDVAPSAPTYTCQGFDAPMNSGTVAVRKQRVLPLKANLIDDSGEELTDLDLVAPPAIQITFTAEGTSEPIDVTDDALPAGHETEGNQFVYGGGRWRFNLATRDYTASGTYEVSLISGNASEYNVVSCVGTFAIDAD